MNAINLIPLEERRGGAGAPGRAGNAAYILLGVLGMCVIAAAAFALTGNSIKHRRADLGRATAEANGMEAQAKALRPYADFAGLKAKRLETVQGLADSRFDWERVLRDLSKAMPSSSWLTSFTGTVAPGVNVEGGAGGELRGAIPVPAVQLEGCADSQVQVARMMSRMRLIEGVTRVSLEDSVKNDTQRSSGGGVPQGAGGGTGGGSGDCRQGSDKFPQFHLVLFFEDKTAAPPSATGTTPAPSATGAAATATTSANGASTAAGAQPASSTSTTPSPAAAPAAPAPGSGK